MKAPNGGRLACRLRFLAKVLMRNAINKEIPISTLRIVTNSIAFRAVIQSKVLFRSEHV